MLLIPPDSPPKCIFPTGRIVFAPPGKDSDLLVGQMWPRYVSGSPSRTGPANPLEE